MTVGNEVFNEQGTDEWKKDRVGKLGSSRLDDATKKIEEGKKAGQYYAARESLMSELIAERISMEPTPTFETPAIRWGRMQEPNARREYVARTGFQVHEAGFIPHPTIKFFGSSPDGLSMQEIFPEEGGLEIKCLHTSNHLKIIITGDYSDYVGQMYGGMLCNDRKTWWDFVAYDPRLGDELGYFCDRVEYDSIVGANYEKEATLFLDELDFRCRELLKKYPKTLEIYNTNWS